MQSINQQENVETPPVTVSAASLLLKCAGFLDDRNAAARNDIHHCITYYAVDPDVVSLYLDPGSSFSFLDVFGEGARSNTVQSLAFLMGDFLFASNARLIQEYDKHESRFLLIPPHDEELLRIVSAIHRDLLKVADDVNERQFGALSKAFDRYEASNNAEVLLIELRQQVPKLVELFNPYQGPKAALTRFAQLSETTIQRVDSYHEKDGFAFPLLDPINNRDDRRVSDKLIEQWESRLYACLRKRKNYTIRDYSVRRDAEVLAMIEHVNGELRRTEKHKRLALITGSSYLFDAASAYFPQGVAKLNFADKYLRHPQAFLVHPDFFSQPFIPTDSSDGNERFTFRLIDWLNLFFPAELRPAHQPLGLVRRNLLHFILSQKQRNFDKVFEELKSADKDSKPIKTLLDGWESQIASKAKAQYADGLKNAEKRGAHELAEKLNALKKKNQWSLKGLHELIFKESVESASKLYSTTAWMGLWRDVLRQQAKGIPAPRFDDKYKVIEEYCREVVRLQIESGSSISTEQLGKLHSLYQQVMGIDPSGYHIHVVHALAFATKGHWHATLTLAITAIEICRQIPAKERRHLRFLKGREAAYLACIAARRSVQNRSDLERAEEFLRLAIELENDGSEEDIRFTAERLAIQTRYHYFDCFCDEKPPNADRIVATISGMQQLIRMAECELNDWVRHWVQRQSLTNFFSLLLMLRDMQVNNEVFDMEALMENLTLFGGLLSDKAVHDNKPENDPYAHMICDIATAIWGVNPELREGAKKRALDAVEVQLSKANEEKDGSQSSSAVVPYNEARLEFLRKSIPVA